MLLRRHSARRIRFSALREAVAAHGGREVRTVGEGLMVVFTSARSAVDAAVEMQHRVRRDMAPDAEPIGLRVGIATGDADIGEDDFAGRPVEEARQLCAAAAGGQVLVMESVRLLGGDAGGYDLVPAGEITLKGRSEPLAVSEVRYSSEQTVGARPDRRSTPGAACDRTGRALRATTS